MAKDVTTLFRDASELSEEDRATRDGLLIESLEAEPEPDAEAAWNAEIERRVADVEAGHDRLGAVDPPVDEPRHELVSLRVEEGLRPGESPCGPSKPTPRPSKLAPSAGAGPVPWDVCSTAAPAALFGGKAGAPTRAWPATNHSAVSKSSRNVTVCAGILQCAWGPTPTRSRSRAPQK
ncbi:MAG: addiction module protein, partial [Vicinamibacterales bacterium]